MEASIKKSVWIKGLKVGLFSLIFSCIGVLLLALFAKLFKISDTALPIINQVLKAVAVALSTLFFVKDEKFILKAIVGAVVFWVLSFVLFSLIGGAFHWGQIFLDLGVSVATAVLVAVIKSRRA